jgi:hypothetical protein
VPYHLAAAFLLGGSAGVAFDPDKPNDIRKLQDAREESVRDLEGFRQEERKYQRQLVGHHYPDDPASHPVPYNLIDLVVMTMQTVLSANNPRALVVAHPNHLKPTAKKVEIAVNHVLKELQFQRRLDAGVMQAFFSLGAFKVGNELNPRKAIIGFRRETGQPFVENVLFRNWFHDTACDRIEDGRFMGDDRDEYVDWLEERDDLYDPDVVRRMVAQDEDQPIWQSEEYGPKRWRQNGDVFMPRTKVSDVWIPRERVIVGLPGRVDIRVDKPLYVIDWKGPEHGCYVLLSFTDVPGKTMPRPPAALWADIHHSVNLLFNRSIEQAKRAKMVYPYSGPRGYRDMKLMLEAPDGMAVNLRDARSLVPPIQVPGADVNTLKLIDDLIQKFSYFAGNVNLMGGLGAESATLGQDQILREQGHLRMAMYQNRVSDVLVRIFKDVGAYLVNNPLIDLPLTKPVGATKTPVQFRFNPDIQKGDFFDLNFDVAPYSAANMTPAMKSQALLNVLTFLAPFMQAMQAQGLTLDFVQLMELLAQYNNVPEMMDLTIVSGERPTRPELSELSSPNITSRQNVRLDSPRRDGRTESPWATGGASQSGQRPMTLSPARGVA